MEKLRCFAIDDEPLALGQICGYIQRMPLLKFVGSARDAFGAMEALVSANVELWFVDINMPGLSGLDFVKSLGGERMVIFTTAYEQYALEGFRVNAVDYLLKPVSYEDFLKSVTKALSLCRLHGISAPQPEANYLFVQSEYRTVRISFDNIRYIESMSEYVRIHLKEGKPVMSLMSLRSLEERLPTDRFMRVHRSYIVNLDAVQVVERGRILFDPQTAVPIGEQYKDAFQDFIQKHR